MNPLDAHVSNTLSLHGPEVGRYTMKKAVEVENHLMTKPWQQRLLLLHGEKDLLVKGVSLKTREDHPDRWACRYDDHPFLHHH